MTDDEFLKHVVSQAAKKPVGYYYALGDDGCVYRYGYGGLGDWIAALTNDETTHQVQRLLKAGRLRLGEIVHYSA